MKINRIKLYWLLLLTVLFTGIVVLSVGITQARYSNTVTAVAVLKPPAKDITSNCLITADDAPRTVLLGQIDMEKAITVPFWLMSPGADETVRLNWGVSDPVHAEYLNIAVLAGAEVLEPGEEIHLLEDIRLELKLYLVPTESARATYHEETKINVHVTLGDTMWGTFQVILPAVKTVPQNPADPDVSGNDALPADPDVSGNDSLPTDPDVSGNDVEPAESEDAMNPGVVDNKGEIAQFSERTGPSVSGNDAESMDAQIGLKTLTAFDVKRQVPVLMTLAEHITSVRLGVVSEDVKDPQDNTQKDTVLEDITLEPLPNYTMFSVDGGASYYMVYGDFLPEFVLHEITSVPMLIDFSYTQPKQEAELTIAMEAYTGSTLRKTCTSVTATTKGQKTMLLQQELSGTYAAYQVRSNSDGVQAKETESVQGPVLDFDHMLEFTFPLEWKEADLEYSVEYLTMTEDQILQYVPVELSEDGLQATYYEDDDNHRLELRLGRKFTQSGTYRIHISWSYEGLCYDTMKTTFFVNCTGQREALISSSEVANDE